MYARVVFFMCDGRQLLMSCSAHWYCVALSQKGDKGSISTSIFTSKIGVLVFVCQWVLGGMWQPKAKSGERAYFFTLGPSQVGVFLQVPLWDLVITDWSINAPQNKAFNSREVNSCKHGLSIPFNTHLPVLWKTAIYPYLMHLWSACS